jgi:hypothetical protein
MFATLVSRAATALLVGGSLVGAIELNIDDPSMRALLADDPLKVMLTWKYRFDQECSRHVSLRYDDILQGKSERWNNRSAAGSPAEPTKWM